MQIPMCFQSMRGMRKRSSKDEMQSVWAKGQIFVTALFNAAEQFLRIV